MTSNTSLRMRVTLGGGTSARSMTRINSRDLESANVVDLRIRSGMGRAGVVISTEGIPRRSVAAFSDATRGLILSTGALWLGKDSCKGWGRNRSGGRRGNDLLLQVCWGKRRR